MLLTFNCKGIDELTGNPPILIDAPDNKVFKDVLLEVIDKLNPLLPNEKKLTLEGLGIESFDGEPVNYAMYARTVSDVIIDFGTSFVLTLKQVGKGEVAEKDAIDAYGIMSDVLKTEGSPEKKKATPAAVEQELAPPALDEVILPQPKRRSDGDMPGVNQPSIPGGMRARPVVPSPGPAPSPPGVAGPPAASPISNLNEEEPPKIAEPRPSMAVGSASPALPSPPARSEEHATGDKVRAKDFKKEKAPAKLSRDSEMAEEGEEFEHDDGTLARKSARTQYDKSISVDYFDVMNPENYYPIVVDIADIEQAWKPVEENIVTGERKVQVKEKVVFETDTVLVRPVFPGCTVSPPELEADLTKSKDVLTFYATPLVKGGIKGELHFLARGKIVHKTELPAQVQDPRFGRMITLYGLIASMIPKLSTLFSIDLGAMLSVALGITLSSDVLTSIIAIAGTGIASLIGTIYYLSHRPKNARLQLHVSDFRLSIVPPNVP